MTPRETLVEQLKIARTQYETKKAIFAAPYSSYENQKDFNESWGYYCGIAKAIEVLDGFK